MAREFSQESYFDHSRYTNTYYAAQMPLEYFIANVLMRGDLSRIVFSADDIAFRKRFQTADVENGGDLETMKASELNFPFANYWYDGSWVPDDRAFAVQPMQMIRGTWTEGLPAYLQALAVKASFNFTAYYSRDDDARLAHELLLWEQQPKGPVQFATTLRWKDTSLLVPVMMTIEEAPEFNPEYNESDWLKAQRIFPISFKITVRSYSINMQAQENHDNTQRNFSTYSTGIINSQSLYLSEEVILNFAAAKGWGQLTDDTDEVTADLDKEDEFTPEEAATKIAEPREITTDLVRGYFQPSTDIYVNACMIDSSTITTTSFELKWNIRPADYDIFDHIKILVPGHEPVKIEDVRQKSQIINDLYPSSEYKITVLFYSTSGGITDFHLTVLTLEDPSNPVKTPMTRRMGKLKGMEW